MRLHFPAVMVVLVLGACGPAAPPATLPPELGPGQAFVTRGPVVVVAQQVSEFFRVPQAGQPAAAARAIARLEWLADTVPGDPVWQTVGGTTTAALGSARWEARTALGVSTRTPAQPVIDGLAAAAQAIDANDRAALAQALPRSVFPLGPEATVQRLSAPPAVPSAMLATTGLALERRPTPRTR